MDVMDGPSWRFICPPWMSRRARAKYSRALIAAAKVDGVVQGDIVLIGRANPFKTKVFKIDKVRQAEKAGR